MGVMSEGRQPGAVWRGWGSDPAPLVGQEGRCLPTLIQPSCALLSQALAPGPPSFSRGRSGLQKAAPLQFRLTFTELQITGH